jgi:UDP-N-acetylmuramyl pentapeptide phosphotransferase/UDP-N-acetylglucosamine-1-phosphate transferase
MGDATIGLPWHALGAVLIASIAISAGLIVLLRPLLLRYALARPNARSSHSQPTPQGGGIAVVAAALASLWLGVALAPTDGTAGPSLIVLTTGAIVLALLGAVDDLRPLGPAPRLVVQALVIGAIIATLPTEFRISTAIPQPLEWMILFLGGLWFVNLVNFMDGIDWITVAEVVPITAGITLLGVIGAVPANAVLVAVALLGAILGFAPFNRPVARLFLGDVGSLPIGLMLGWVLMILASQGHLAAAILLPLYYLADATSTLVRRLMRGEAVWQAHRTHFYQRASDNGFSIVETVVRIFVLNVALAVLALVSAIEPDLRVDLATLALGGAMVAWLLTTFARSKR